MNHKNGYAALLAGLLASAGPSMAEDRLADLAQQESLNLVITDSGMGGLSVVADIAQRATESKSFREVNIYFVNALFRPRAGYNSLQTREEKIDFFNNALKAMKKRYEPDAILVACNTLSVLLPDCDAATSSSIPVEGIVEAGVDMIVEELAKNPAATALLFATQTTAQEGSHRDALLERGVPEERFVVQACPELTWYIEQDPEGFDTELMISSYVSEALEKRENTSGPVALSFNCTHFCYSLPLWEQELSNQNVELSSTLNPNLRMGDALFPEKTAGRFDSTTVNIRTISMVEISQVTIDALSPVLSRTSTKTAESLRNWELVPDLFEWESVLEEKIPDS